MLLRHSLTPREMLTVLPKQQLENKDLLYVSQVTNQMITTCKLYINQGAAKIWDQNRLDALRKIEDCQMLNREYQKAFHRIKEKLKVSRAASRDA